MPEQLLWISLELSGVLGLLTYIALTLAHLKDRLTKGRP
jgi:hypothetical protein